MGGHMEISASLRESLLQIAEAAHDKSLSTEGKEKKLSELAGPALIMLENMIENVGGTRRELLDELKEMIQSGTWAKLPEPKNLTLTLTKINRISAAISDVKEKLMADSNEIFRELLEIMREIMLENKFSQTVQHKRDIDAADATAKARKTANQKQFSADLGSAIAQGIGGVVSAAGACGSIVSAGRSARNAAEATQLAGGIKNKQKNPADTLDALEKNAEKAKNTLADTKAKIRTDTQDLQSLKRAEKLRRLKPAEITEKTRLEGLVGNNGTLHTQKNNEQNAFTNARFIHKERFDKVDSLRKQADTDVAMANAIQSLAGSIASVTNSAGGIASAMEKQSASSAQLDADKEGINREVAQKMYQAASDSANSAREALRSAMSMISAIEQTFSSMNSILARNSV